VKDVLILAKPRIALLVMLTAALGYSVAGGGFDAVLLWLVVGTGLASAACGTLNQAIEKDQDARMTRTAGRPVASGRISQRAAVLVGCAETAAGLLALWLGVNGIATLLTGLTVFLYVCLYTPLKMVTPQTTWVGAVAGAMPPLIGYAALTGRVSIPGLVLFGIQLLWQIPHFLALFWMYREQYAAAGFQVAPVVDRSGRLTALQIAVHSFTVLPMALAPVYFGMAGPGYGLAALGLSGGYLLLGMKASWSLEPADTRRLFLASLAYLPLLFVSLLIGGV
jgi:protoheme IX farnesyltransferase